MYIHYLSFFIFLLWSTSPYPDTVATGTIYVPVFERCLPYTESPKRSKERQHITLGVHSSMVSINLVPRVFIPYCACWLDVMSWSRETKTLGMRVGVHWEGRVVKSSRLPAKIAAYLVRMGRLLCLAFLYGWHF